MATKLDGILLIDKEEGETSYTTVRRIGQILKVKKAGHAGTLDPAASGLMIILLGQGTKLAPYLMTQDKEYRAVIRLGIVTDTLDGEGRVTRATRVAEINTEQLQRCLATFIGEIEQTPPAFSALKIRGKPAYYYARRGEQVDLVKRKVTIRQLAVQAIEPPDITLLVACSSGTYVRSLAAELGERLGLGGYLKALRRLSIGPFSIDEAASLAKGNADFLSQQLLGRIIPLKEAVNHLQELEVDEETARKIRNGRQIPLKELSPFRSENDPKPKEIRLVCEESLVAIARWDPLGSQEVIGLKILRVFQ